MMNHKKDSGAASVPFVNIGSASLLVVFLVLCLVTFATLSLSAALSDYKFSQRLAERRDTYYEASSQSEELLQKIDEILWENYEISPTEYPALSQQIFDSGNWGDVVPELEQTDDSCTIRWQIPLNDQQALSVRLILADDTAEGGGLYRIQQWKIIQTSDWESTQTLHLMTIDE